LNSANKTKKWFATSLEFVDTKRGILPSWDRRMAAGPRGFASASRGPMKRVLAGLVAQKKKKQQNFQRSWSNWDGPYVPQTNAEKVVALQAKLDKANLERGTPPHALVVASSTDHSDTVLLVNEEIGHMHPRIHGSMNEDIRADMMFFETAKGGAVFSTGSIAYVSALPCNAFDNNIATLTANVITRFCDPTPF